MRRLLGYIRRDQDSQAARKNDLDEIDLGEMGRLIAQHGLADLPWQLSAASITQMNPPAHAYREGQAYIVLSNPTAEHVVVWSLLVEPEARGSGLGTELLKRVGTYWPGKTWHIPALCPEEFGVVFERAGFEQEKLSQWQMRLDL